MRRRWNRWTGMALVLLTVGACGGDDSTGPPEEDPDAIAPFVGTWDAEVFTVTSDADPSIVADLMENGSFTINVQPSGTYTATLTFGGIPLVEIGEISVQGDFIILLPNGGEPATSSYEFVRSDYVRLEGPTEFDFNLDGELDPAQAFIELQRR